MPDSYNLDEIVDEESNRFVMPQRETHWCERLAWLSVKTASERPVNRYGDSVII